MMRVVRAFSILLSLSPLGACTPSGEGKVAYVGMELWDGTGAPVIHDAVLIVADGRIEAVGPPDLVSIPRGATEVRLDGRWVIPGLIDAHTHVARWALPRWLAYGVTTIREMGGQRDTVLALRAALDDGSIEGPRMYISGAAIDGVPPTTPSAAAVRLTAEARREVSRRILEGVSQIAVLPRLERHLLEAVLDEASVFDTPVAAQLGKVDALTAAGMGVAVIEHLSGIPEAIVADPTALYAAHDDVLQGWNFFEAAWARFDSVRIERAVRALAATGAAIVPTLVLHESWGHLANDAYSAGLDLRGVPEAERRAWNLRGLVQRARLQSGDFPEFRRGRPAQDLFVRRYAAAGGLVLAGTNAPGPLLAPGASLHHELTLLVGAGLTPRAALLAATRDAARLLRVDSIGTLQPGRVADFVILSADPLVDIRGIAQVQGVVVAGVSHDPERLRSAQ